MYCARGCLEIGKGGSVGGYGMGEIGEKGGVGGYQIGGGGQGGVCGFSLGGGTDPIFKPIKNQIPIKNPYKTKVRPKQVVHTHHRNNKLENRYKQKIN